MLRRDREDDPNAWELDTLLGLASGLNTVPVADDGEL
jgi:hypothetical protein